MVKLSIVTINYNNRRGLHETMLSVFAQSFSDYEYIIIDGGSTDGSVDIIQERREKLAYWVSEKDKGIYHAMNKGIAKALGEYLLFLNSGDVLTDDKSLTHFAGFTEDILCADIKINNGSTNMIKRAVDKPSFEFFMGDTLPHQSALIRRSLFSKAGSYNEELKFVSDWKFYLDALCKFSATYRHIPVVVASYNNDGISSEIENAPLLHGERQEILAREYPMFYNDYLRFKNCRAELRNYTSSRAHMLINKLIGNTIYQKIKNRF